MLAAGWWVAKRGVPADSSTTGRVGRLWLAPGGGSMRHDSGAGEGGWPLAWLMLQGWRRLTALRPEPATRQSEAGAERRRHSQRKEVTAYNGV